MYRAGLTAGLISFSIIIDNKYIAYRDYVIRMLSMICKMYTYIASNLAVHDSYIDSYC